MSSGYERSRPGYQRTVRAPAPKFQKLRRFRPDGTVNRLFSDLSATDQSLWRAVDMQVARDEQFDREVEKAVSLAELRYLRRTAPGEYRWTNQGWVLVKPK